MKKKVLIIGCGAKCYAFAKKMSEDCDVYVAPYSSVIAEFATCVDIQEDCIKDLLEFVMENDIDMTIPISDKSINSGIAKLFNNNNQLIFAPLAEANEIISNKALAKKTMYKLRIPTPKFGIFEKENLAIDYIKTQKMPFVVKTNDKLSSTIVTSAQSAKNLLNSMYIERNKRVIIEDYVYGTPFSFYAVTDGYNALPVGSSLNYRHSLEGGGGQLTSGMGSCSPNYKISVEQEYFLMDNVIYSLLEFLQAEGNPYLGILGLNGIITEDGTLQILGFESFTQDSDTASVFDVLDENLYELFHSCIIGTFSDEKSSIKLKDKYSVSVVLNCRNKNNKENIIEGLDNINDDTIISFFPSVEKNKYLEYEANYGAVMIVTSSAGTVSRAANIVYNEIEDINFNAKYFRKDICKLNCKRD